MFSVKNNRLMMALTIVFLLLFTHTGAQERQLEGPQNTLSVVGSNVILKCVSASKSCQHIEWDKQNSGSPMSVFRENQGILYPFKERYSVENSSGCGLVIRNVELTDAGRFICKTYINSSAVEKSAYLIILKNQPKCMTNASQDKIEEGDSVHLTCEVTYNGTYRTSMVWKDVDDAPAAMVKNKTISQFYSIVASAPEVPSFTCFTSFAVEGDIEGLAKNIPVTTCVTRTIKVLYSVRDVQLSQSFSNYPPGTVITCTAKGHPSPTFKWQEMENEGTWMDIQNQNGNKFTMPKVSSKWYRCVAMNVVREKSYNASSDEFQVNNTGSVPIGVGVVAGFLLLIILLVICFCVRSCPGYKCCYKSKAKLSREEQPLRQNPDIYSNVSQLGEQESAYASLGTDRDANEYMSLELQQKAKAEKKSRP